MVRLHYNIYLDVDQHLVSDQFQENTHRIYGKMQSLHGQLYRMLPQHHHHDGYQYRCKELDCEP